MRSELGSEGRVSRQLSPRDVGVLRSAGCVYVRGRREREESRGREAAMPGGGEKAEAHTGEGFDNALLAENVISQ